MFGDVVNALRGEIVLIVRPSMVYHLLYPCCAVHTSPRHVCGALRVPSPQPCAHLEGVVEACPAREAGPEVGEVAVGEGGEPLVHTPAEVARVLHAPPAHTHLWGGGVGVKGR